MKKYLGLLVLVAACAPKVTTTTKTQPVETAATAPAPLPASNEPGAATARSAVDLFLTAIRAGDIQAMSVIFGTNHGPSRDNMNREELEKRLVILQCYFNHEKSRIINEFPGEAGHRVVEVELIKQGVTRTPNFYAIQGPGGRWYVDNMEIAAVRDFCRKPGT